MTKQIDEISLSDFVPQSWSRAAQNIYAPGMQEVIDKLDDIEDLARQGVQLSEYPTRSADRLSMKVLSMRVLEAVRQLQRRNLPLRAKRFHAHWIRMHLKELQDFVRVFTSDEKAMQLMKRKAERETVGGALRAAKGRTRDMEDSTTDPNRPRAESMTFSAFLRSEILTEEKYMCRNGHLHNSQDRATNCATCKRQERKRAEKAAQSSTK